MIACVTAIAFPAALFWSTSPPMMERDCEARPNWASNFSCSNFFSYSVNCFFASACCVALTMIAFVTPFAVTCVAISASFPNAVTPNISVLVKFAASSFSLLIKF